MALELKQVVSEYSDEKLRTELTSHREDYTSEGLAILQQEAIRRRLVLDKPATHNSQEPQEIAVHSADGAEFVALENTFSRTDLVLVDAMLRDGGIAFYVDTPKDSEVLPVSSNATTRYVVNVLGTKLQSAREIVETHFMPHDQHYQRIGSSPLERIKGFGFHEVRLAEEVLEEVVSVGLGAGEQALLDLLVKRLLREADEIERSQERVLFFYDNLEPLHQALLAGSSCKLTTLDLLTVLEVIQVYCDEPQCAQELLATGVVLIDYLESLH